ncbi:hypothetical protein FSARC_6605 [Fusarium sarcochroum]|uniref:G domain-containing protein n=1 Tax=Fusarium sarcochroum TaxID=1208366 RepID=A0A8H4TX52_9HYPO|nr:hypothetical protein FSARC_6605 [Fusarium sarcochroum]
MADNCVSHLCSSDVIVLVMGLTGAGKSTFIERLTDQDAGIGHTLMSETSRLGLYCHVFGNRRVFLVDTPGFDDSRCMDTAIFKDIAFLLSQAYINGVRLGGILYLHRITDNRATGSAMRSFQLLHKICGIEGAKFARLVTTMWDEISVESSLYSRAMEREEELKSTEGCWGWMSDRGSRIQRCMATRASALSALSSLLAVSDVQGPAVLQLQQELIDENKDLDDTAAGIELSKHHGTSWQRLQRELKALQTSHQLTTEDSDSQFNEQLRAQRLDVERQLEVAETSERDLRQEVESMFTEKAETYRDLFIQTRKEVTHLSNEIEMLKQELKRVEGSSDLHKQVFEDAVRVSTGPRSRGARQSQTGAVRRSRESDEADSRIQITGRFTEDVLPSPRDPRRRPSPIPRSQPRSQVILRPTKLQKGRKPEYLIEQMSKEERGEYLEKKLAKKEKRKVIKRNTLSILGMLGGLATIAAGAATLQIPVVAAGIALFGTAGMKLDISKKKKRIEKGEWQVSEHD